MSRNVRRDKRIESDIHAAASKYAEQFGVPYDLIRAVIQIESTNNPRATSEKGAQGVMQLMPGTQKTYGVEDPYDIDQSIRGGTEFLSVLMNKYPDNIELVLAAYNAGEGAVNTHGGVPPFEETQNFIQRVLTAQQELQGEGAAATHQRFRWVYPTPQVEQEVLEAVLGQYGPDATEEEWEGVMENPYFQGIKVSYQWPKTYDEDREGWTPSLEEKQHIHEQVNPAGFITREDAPGIAASIPGVVGLAKIARNPLSPVGLGLTAGAGLFGAGGEYYRQSQVPRDIRSITGGPDVRVERWPRETMTGVHYEGAPQNFADLAWAMSVAGTHEAAGEYLGGKIMGGVAKGGKKLWESGLRGITKTAERNPGLDADDLAEHMWRIGAMPTEQSYRKLEPVVSEAIAETPRILRGASDASRVAGGVTPGPRLTASIEGLEPHTRQVWNQLSDRDWAGGVPGRAERTAVNQLRQLLESYKTQVGEKWYPYPWQKGVPESAVKNVQRRLGDKFYVEPIYGSSRVPLDVLDANRRNLTSRAAEAFNKGRSGDVSEGQKHLTRVLRDRIAASLPEDARGAYLQNLKNIQRHYAARNVVGQSFGEGGGIGSGRAQSAMLGLGLAGGGLAMSENPELSALTLATMPLFSPVGRSRIGRAIGQGALRSRPLLATAARGASAAADQGFDPPGWGGNRGLYEQGNPFAALPESHPGRVERPLFVPPTFDVQGMARRLRPSQNVQGSPTPVQRRQQLQPYPDR
jgi:hypothetical protein